MSDTPENIEEPEVEVDTASQDAADHAEAVAEASTAADPEFKDEAAVAAEAGDAQVEAEADAEAVTAEAEDEPVAEEDPAAEVEVEEPAAEVDETPAAEAPVAETPKRVIPSRRRDRLRDPNEPKPVVKAQAKYVRSSARKARLVCDNFRGKTVEEARAILAVTPRHVARDWSKLLESAVANAEHNHELDGEDLFVVSVQADEGPTIKRFRPRAQGRATQIRKRTAHLTILLTPKD